MIYLDEDAVQRLLNPIELINAIKRAFSGEFDSPARSHYTLPGGNAPTLLLMPAWHSSSTIGVKIVTIDLGRNQQGFPSVEGIYVLLDGRTGRPSAMLGARALTAARTAAVSALAASFLAPEGASNLLMVGTGNLAPYLIEAHRCVRPIKKLMIWGRSRDRAKALADRLGASIADIEVETVTNLRSAVARADVISCATSSHAPLVLGRDVASSTHVDLVGSFRPEMREADDALFEKGRVIVDTMAAFAESGDLIQPSLAGIIDAASSCDLATIIGDATLHRRNQDEITIFKAVGTAISDLAAAEYLLNRHAMIGSAHGNDGYPERAKENS